MASDGLGGLAKKWLKAKATELTTADRRTREAADHAADETARQLRNDSVGEAVMTAIPGLRRLRDQQLEGARQSAARQEQAWRDELAARPVASLRLTLRGALDGTWSGTAPTSAEVVAASADDDDRDPFAGRPALVVDVGPLAPATPPEAIAPLAGWHFEVPGFDGRERYDLAEIGMARRAADAEPEYIDWALSFGDDHEQQFFFQPDLGAATVEVADGGRRLAVTMTMVGDPGEVTVDATIELPDALAQR